jgi:hypothetical protein
MKKLTIILAAILALSTVAEGIAISHTLRLDYTGDFAVWYMPTVDLGAPVTFCPTIIVQKGAADLYTFGGISTPIGLSFNIGPGISVNTDDRIGFIKESSGWLIGCYAHERLTFNSFNAMYFPQHDTQYYWGRQQLKLTLSKSTGLFSGAQVEGCIYANDPKSITTGPNTGLDFGGGCLEFYYGVNPDDSTNRKIRVRWTVGL